VSVLETLHVTVSYSQLGRNTSSDVYLAGMPVLSVAHINDVFEDQLWYQFIWYVDGVPYCKAINKSFCLLTYSSAGNYSVNIAAIVLVNVTTGAESVLIKRKSKVVEHQLLVKGKQVTCLNCLYHVLYAQLLLKFLIFVISCHFLMYGWNFGN